MKGVYRAWYEHRSMGAVLDRAMEVKVFVVETNSTFLTQTDTSNTRLRKDLQPSLDPHRGH